ncbi:asialoglycoprotein receptor 1-like isoform X2 [Cloeon dipterum]|uniref:asialoglycoprotein receptor 1-like isoform X2 n=1 Tax=Cloeon dipterum TaxID=197152 RepID=UPI00322099A4
MVVLGLLLIICLSARVNADIFPEDDDSCHIQVKIVKDLVSKCGERSSSSGADFSANSLPFVLEAVRESNGNEIQKLNSELKKEFKENIGTISKMIDEFQSEMRLLANTVSEVNAKQNRFEREVSSKVSDISMNLEATRRYLNDLKSSSIRNPEKDTSHCPSDVSNLTVLPNGKTYLFSNETRVCEPVTWYEAKVLCEMQKLHLASPKTQQELTYVHRKARELTIVPWWLSASDARSNAGQFFWHDGTSLSTNSLLWSEGEPSDYGQGNEACVWIRSNASDKLEDSKCSSYFHYICEQPAACISHK